MLGTKNKEAPPAAKPLEEPKVQLPQTQADDNAGKTNLPAAYDYSDDQGGGFENMDKADFLVPIVDIVHNNSKEVAELKTATAGQLIIRALGITIDAIAADKQAGVSFIPCVSEHVFNEWTPRKRGGGLKKVYLPEDQFVTDCKALALDMKLKFGKLVTERDAEKANDLVETYNLYSILLLDGEPMPVLVPFTSTKIGRYKGLATKARSLIQRTPTGIQKVPLYGTRWRMQTEFKKNNDGSWYLHVLSYDGKDATEARLKSDSDLFQLARAFKIQVLEGAVKADMKGTEGADADEGGDPGARPSGDSDRGGPSGEGSDGKKTPF